MEKFLGVLFQKLQLTLWQFTKILISNIVQQLLEPNNFLPKQVSVLIQLYYLALLRLEFSPQVTLVAHLLLTHAV